ncbi:MAG: NAD(P)-dependent alcohol dehydrogenase [Hyphomonadaceae bacterium]|nr:MAG: aryl-alcohol dehydrogenase [Caulobacteraceae bacterium]MBT9447187.1 NAD(P)-dependent alcohol dehydrogenase [Hyphomonadaceae bacterium]TPW08209.1 MAG: aryl-alcohol dehydrogenase [Alphaproteobacteria bacterium]
MRYHARAAVLRTHGGAMRIEPVEIDAPRHGEVLIKIAATGICHTDMVMRDGHLPIPTPVVLGHEGAGHVVEIGTGVTHVRVGDPVLLSFANCGVCRSCTAHEPAYCHNFVPLNFLGARADGSTALHGADGPIHSHIFGQSAFATHAIASASNVVKAPPDLPIERLGPLGCGIQTGAGAVLNSLRVQAGSTVLVMGAGAVGLSAVMAARIVGASEIVAIDLSETRLALSRELGATRAIKSDGRSVSELLNAAGLSGADYIIDTTGVARLAQEAVAALCPRGTLALVAAYPPGAALNLDAAFMMSAGRRVIGVVEGGSDPQKFIPELIAYHKRGLLPFDRMIETFAFENLHQAIEAGESGRVVKPVVLMG